jgi:hypothetical protein
MVHRSRQFLPMVERRSLHRALTMIGTVRGREHSREHPSGPLHDLHTARGSRSASLVGVRVRLLPALCRRGIALTSARVPATCMTFGECRRPVGFETELAHQRLCIDRYAQLHVGIVKEAEHVARFRVRRPVGDTFRASPGSRPRCHASMRPSQRAMAAAPSPLR